MIGLTPQTLLALASKHWTSNPALIAATMLSCKATLADLVDAAHAAGHPDAEAYVADMVQKQVGDANWRELAEEWARAKRPPDEPIPVGETTEIEAPCVAEVVLAGQRYRITIERVAA